MAVILHLSCTRAVRQSHHNFDHIVSKKDCHQNCCKKLSLCLLKYNQSTDCGKQFNEVHKNAWNLTTGHHSAPFQMGAELGGMNDMFI